MGTQIHAATDVQGWDPRIGLCVPDGQAIGPDGREGERRAHDLAGGCAQAALLSPPKAPRRGVSPPEGGLTPSASSTTSRPRRPSLGLGQGETAMPQLAAQDPTPSFATPCDATKSIAFRQHGKEHAAGSYDDGLMQNWECVQCDPAVELLEALHVVGTVAYRGSPMGTP